MLSIFYKTKPPAPDEGVGSGALDAIVNDAKAMRPLSKTQARRYARAKATKRQSVRDVLIESAGHLDEELVSGFAEIRALQDDPLPLVTDTGADVFAHLNKATG